MVGGGGSNQGSSKHQPPSSRETSSTKRQRVEGGYGHLTLCDNKRHEATRGGFRNLQGWLGLTRGGGSKGILWRTEAELGELKRISRPFRGVLAGAAGG